MLNQFFCADETDKETCSCGCGHDHDHDQDTDDLELTESLITMVDQETGEEYDFIMADDFEFEGQVYCLLLTVDEEEQSAVFVRVEEQEDGTEGFVSLEDDEFDRVAEE